MVNELRKSAASDRSLLQVKDLKVAYGAAQAVHGATLSVSAGEYVALLGPNGAGKSTILNAIAGLLPKRSGQVVFDGKDISRASPREIVRLGLALVLEGHRVFEPLTVEDNLALALHGSGKPTKNKSDRMFDLFPELKPMRNLAASRLSGGQKQILAVMQGIIVEPKLLMLDEPSLGLAPLIVDRILDVAADLASQGTSVLLVEQAAEKALARCDTAYVIDAGKIVHSAPAQELASTDFLHQSYMGKGSHAVR